MRKTSHDGGDSTSITSGVENEVKKSALKSKKSSLKKKTPIDFDDTVIEPLLQKDKQKSETVQSAKYLTKGKTDSTKNNDMYSNAQTSATTGFCGTTESLLSTKDSVGTNSTSSLVGPIHNYMNTNVFNTHDTYKVKATTKSQVLVEIDSTKQSGYNPSPLIFTTAKIHTDGKSKDMEPVQMTPIPIISTIEVSMAKGGSFITSEKKNVNDPSITNSVYSTSVSNKDKNEKDNVNSSPTVVKSPTTTGHTLQKSITISTNELSNNTLVQSSSTNISLPTTTSKALSTTTHTNGSQMTIKDFQKTQAQNIDIQTKPFNLDKIKNGVTVKTTTPSSNKVNLVNITTKPMKANQIDTTQNKKLNAKSSDTKTPTNAVSEDSQHFVTNVETPSTSKKSLEASNTPKNYCTTISNMQLQRQKSTTVETNDVSSKPKSNIENAKESSAKTQYISHSKVTDSTFIKDNDKLSKICSIDTLNLNKKPIKATGNQANNATSMSIIETKTSTPVNISNKSSTAPINIYKLNNETTPAIGSTATKSSVTVVDKALTNPKANTKEVISIPPAGSVFSVSEKTPSETDSEDKIKTTLSSDYSRTVTATTTKSLPSATTITIPAMNKTHGTKPSDTTLIKPKFLNDTKEKASINTSKVIEKTEPTAISAGVGAAVKPLIFSKKTTVGAEPSASITKTPQIITSQLASTNKQPDTSISLNIKTPSVGTSGVSTVNSGVTTTTLKSPNNLSQSSVSTTQSTPVINKTTQSARTLAKITNSSASGTMTSAAKSSQSISSANTEIKEAASAKKSPVPKTQAITTAKNSPMSSVNNSTIGITAKVPHCLASSVPTTIAKYTGPLVGKTIMAKTPSVTSMKTPLVTTLGKTSSVTSVSSPTTSATSPNLTTTQTSAKLVGIAASSVPSSTRVQQPSDSKDSVKKGESKSSGNNKDGKFSKA